MLFLIAHRRGRPEDGQKPLGHIFQTKPLLGTTVLAREATADYGSPRSSLLVPMHAYTNLRSQNDYASVNLNITSSHALEDHKKNPTKVAAKFYSFEWRAREVSKFIQPSAGSSSDLGVM